MTPHEIVMLVIAAIGAIVAVVTGFIGYQNGLKKTSNRDGEERGVLMTEIGYIKAGIDDIKKQQDRQDRAHNDLNIRVTTLENEQKTMWKRIDETRKSIEEWKGEKRV